MHSYIKKITIMNAYQCFISKQMNCKDIGHFLIILLFLI